MDKAMQGLISKDLPKIDHFGRRHWARRALRNAPDIPEAVKVFGVREMARVGADE